MALAYNLSTAVLEWHFAKTPEERQRDGICVKWRPFSVRNKNDDVQSLGTDITQEERLNAQMLGVNYGSDDEDIDEPQKDYDMTVDSMIGDALDNEIQPKNEEFDDQSAFALLRMGGDSEVVHETRSESGNVNHDHALKTSSADPVLGGSKSSSQSTNGDGDAPIASVKPSEPDVTLSREQLAYSADNQLFIDLDSIHLHDPVDKGNAPTEPHDPTDLPSLFPDLQPLGLLDVPPPSGTTDGKKKVEKRSSDRDDPNKRIEDTSYTKLYPTGKFMYTKPTLIGPLQPSKNWKDGKWQPIDNTYLNPDPEVSIKISEENTNGKCSVTV